MTTTRRQGDARWGSGIVHITIRTMAVKTEIKYCPVCKRKTAHKVDYIPMPTKADGTKDPDFVSSVECMEHEA